MIVIVVTATISGQFALDEHFGAYFYRLWRA